MTVTVGEYEFDQVRYDSDGDVLRLRQGESHETPRKMFATPEGHLVLLDQDGEVTGITFISAKSLIDRDGKLPVTFPRLIEPDAGELAQALVG
jgi:uncharacterized protein YuzE